MAPILSPREIFPSNSWSHLKQHKYDEALNRDDDGSDVVHSLVAAKKVLRRMNMSKCGKILPQDENGDLAGGGMERSNTKYYSQCRCVTYCSRECQKARLTNHKSYCERDAALIAIFHKPDFDANAVM
eukprot:scaffold7325_cov153-Skeletonema_menzelii.AAC.2